jgi:hypothetical protein
MMELNRDQIAVRSELHDLVFETCRKALGVAGVYWGDLSPAEKREFSLLLLETAAVVEAQMRAEVEQFAYGAVNHGASLAEVGRAYGISRQAASKRWPIAAARAGRETEQLAESSG